MAEPRRKTKAKAKRIIGGARVTVTVEPAQPAFPEPTEAAPPPEITPRTLFSQHLDGVDEHRCNRCHIAYAERAPLCIEGAKLHRACMKWEKEQKKQAGE